MEIDGRNEVVPIFLVSTVIHGNGFSQRVIEAFNQAICLGVIGRGVEFLCIQKATDFLDERWEEVAATIRQEGRGSTMSRKNFFDQETGDNIGTYCRLNTTRRRLLSI